MGIVCILLWAYWVVLIARVILSWFTMASAVPPGGAVRRILEIVLLLTEPVLRPLRGVLPAVPIGMARLDLSPIIVFIVLGILLRVAC